MIIVKTPFRVSFFGGGSDFPEWFNKNGGAVISTSINKYVYLIISNPLNSTSNYIINYSKNEQTNKVSEINHPCFRNFLQHFKIKKANFTFMSDLPAFSGLASSSALSVSLINYLLFIKNKNSSKKNISKATIDFERKVLKEEIGYQDQIAVTYGGVNHIKFKNNDFKITNIKISQKTINKFRSNYFLLDTGIKRYSSIIQKKLVRSFEISRPNSKVIFEMVEYSNIAKKLITKGNLDDLGYLFKEYWNLKIKSNPHAINNEISDIYNMAIKKGAFSGKLLGAGSGGFFLFYVKNEYINNFSKLGKLFNIYPLEVEFDGTKLFNL